MDEFQKQKSKDNEKIWYDVSLLLQLMTKKEEQDALFAKFILTL